MNADHIMTMSLRAWVSEYLQNVVFSLSKVNCDGNTLFVRTKGVEDFSIFFKSTMHWLKPLLLLKSKKFPRVFFERTKRVSQPEFTDQNF